MDTASLAAAPSPIECTIETPASPALLTPTRGHKASEVPSMFLLDSYNNQADINDRPPMPPATPFEEPDPNFEVKLTSCPICARRFNPATYKKHVPICERTASRKRKIFDSSRQRREGTDLAAYPLPKGFGLPPVPKEIIASPKVETGAVARVPQVAPGELSRRKSNDEFTRTPMRSSMRKLSNASGTGSVEGSSSGGGNSPHVAAPATVAAPAITPTSTSKAIPPTATPSHAANPAPITSNFTRDRLRSSERTKRTQQPPAEQCPHCDRCFGMKAYDRHVAWCKEKALQNSIKHQGSKNEQNVAKERLEARTKYRAPNLKSKRSVNREKYAGFQGDENDFADQSRISGNNSIMSLSMTSSLNSEGGVTDKYDPFLSAKRQLEELCSPTITNDPLDSLKIPNTAPTTPKTPLTPSTPSINIQPIKMSTSLNLSKSSPNSSPMTNSTIQNRTFSNLPIKATTHSNFRRTSSLRGPRRSPMLAARPLFAQKPPTIQRGLSDEGPISSSFLKPEEYDEMPVRSVCVNDFAVTNSPRVVRRDTSLSNRKNTAKNTADNTFVAGNTVSGDERSPKDLLKTDSLAVFLKYETELEKINQPNVGMKPEAQATSHSSPLEMTGPVITKELKDKSNTLSKQNSSKNIRLEPLETPKPVDEPEKSVVQLSTATTAPSTNTDRSNLQMSSHSKCVGQFRLDPISKPSTPLTKSGTPLGKPDKNSQDPKTVPNFSQTINLDCIFNDSKLLSALGKDCNKSSSSEFIDPKLINKCDNLPMNLTDGHSPKHSDSDGSGQRTDSSSNSETAAPTPATQISQLTKSLGQSTDECAAQPMRQKPIVDDNQSQCSESRSLLKRKMRLGRNQFLYDASPEGELPSTDDETKRSSAEYDSNDFQHIDSIHKHFMPHRIPSSIPTLPTFDDFDFEEFLSSFENDDEQFPLFKDCKEFLLNRTSNRHRSTHPANSNPLANKSPLATTAPFQFTTNNNHNNNNNHNINTKPHPSEKLQFPHLTNIHYCPSPLTPSSHRSNTTLMSKESVHVPLADNYQGETEHKKREIFISIETEQNDLGRSPISPTSLRHMIGNSQTNVEVEVDANTNDNKFSKISDDEASVVSAEHMSGPYRDMHRLPNVQLNNAKNLMQRMQDDFRQIGHGISQHAVESLNRSTPHQDDDCGACDSDEMSSVDSYPISSQSSRHGVGIKVSADSAYGSLSRQRSSDSTVIRPSHARSRPATAGAVVSSSIQSPRYGISKLQQQVQQQPQPQHYRHSSKTRGRQLSGVSSGSSSDNSLPPLGGYSNVSNGRYEKNSNHKYSNVSGIAHKSKNNNGIETSPLTVDNLVAVNNNNNNKLDGSKSHANLMNQSNSSSSSMSSSTKMSKFCHECGTKFIIEHAKFCMDCGVKRIIL